MTRIIPILFILISCGSKTERVKIESVKQYSNVTKEKDTLFSIKEGRFEYGSSCGYRNEKGDTILPKGTFMMCFTDTFVNYAYVFDKNLYGEDMVAINRNKEVIFDAYLFDNAPGYISDGLFRIKRNGKIGFANELGEVIIEPKFECAYAFENGMAKVAYNCETKVDHSEHSTWESSNWISIDKNGNKIK